MLRKDTAEKIAIVLLTGAGTRATGITAASDISNNRLQLVKADGSTSFVSLTDASNWVEVDSTNSPGLYYISLTGSHTDQLGTLVWTIKPSGAAFVTASGSDIVTSLLADVANIYSRVGAPVGASISADVAGVTTSIKGTQNISISDIAGGVAFSPATDNLDQIRQAVGGVMGAMPPQTPPSVWDELRNVHVGAGTFGEAIRILYQVARGHIKVDKDNNQLVVYQENGTTPLFTCNLLRNGIPASIHADERLGG